MSESDHLPTQFDPNATTKTMKRRTMAMKLSPETTANLQLGSLATCAIAIVVATIFVWTIKTNSEQAVSEIKAFREEVVPAMKKVDRLWWDYETRTAGRPNEMRGQP